MDHHPADGNTKRRKRPRDDSTSVIYNHDYDLLSTKRHASARARSFLSAPPLSIGGNCNNHHSQPYSVSKQSIGLTLPTPPVPPQTTTLHETWGNYYSKSNATLRECHFLRVDRHQRHPPSPVLQHGQEQQVQSQAQSFPMSFSLSLSKNSSPPLAQNFTSQQPPPVFIAPNLQVGQQQSQFQHQQRSQLQPPYEPTTEFQSQ